MYKTELTSLVVFEYEVYQDLEQHFGMPLFVFHKLMEPAD